MSDNSVTRTGDEANRDAELESVIADYIRACDAGTTPDCQAILERHPDLADDLREFFGQRDRMNQLAGPIREIGDSLFQRIGPGKHISYVGDYELLEEVARGGMGVVYKARQKTLGRIVAVKMMLTGRLANEDDVKRFQIEAQAAASLQHPNIVPIHEVGQHEGLHYFSMDFVEGRSLASLLRENVLPPKDAANIVRIIAEAIHYAHLQGTLHRDLKPSNILMSRLGLRPDPSPLTGRDGVPTYETLTPRITDFGLAMRVEGDSGLTQTGQIVGTPSYMPPEQAQGKRSLIGPGSDVYSLGAILYECLTGRAPFRADSVMKTIEQVIHREAASPRLLNSGVARDLETICLKCLEKEPHRRYGTAQLLADDLGRFLRDEPIVARPTKLWERSAKWIRRHPTAAALVFVSAVAMLALVGVGVGQHYYALLESANASLKTANTNLETTSAKLQTTLQAVQVEKTEAERQRALATEAEAKARRFFYAAQMGQVEQARQQNQPERVVQLLRSVIPESEDQEDPRGFEWHHLWRLYHGEQSRLRGHKGAVRAVAFSPDDRLLASAGDDTTIKLWDTTTGKESFTLTGHTARVTGLSFNPNGKRLASCSADKNVKVWDIEARRELLTLEGHEATVTSVAFSPDDKHVASGSEDKTVRVWDSSTGDMIKAKSFTDSVSGVAFNVNGNRLACVAHSDEPVPKKGISPLVWEPLTGLEVTLHGESASQSSVTYSADGALMATGNDPVRGKAKPHIVVWETISPQNQHKFLGEHEGRITHLVFSANAKRLASASLDRTIKVWDVEKSAIAFTFHEASGVYSVSFSPSGLRLASGSGDGAVRLWSTPGPDSVTHIRKTGGVNNISFSPDGRRVGGSSGPGVVVWDAFSGTPLLQLTSKYGRTRAQWSPNGELLACGREIWNAVTGTLLVPGEWYQRSPSGYDCFKVAFSSDSKLLAGAAESSTVRIIDTTTGEVRKSLPIPNWATCVAISPDNKLLAAGSSYDVPHTSGVIKVWRLDSGEKEVALEDAFYLSIWDVAFSPDGTRLAAAIGDYHSMAAGEVVVWDVQTGVALHHFPHRSCVWSVAFSPDGKRLAAASGPLGIRRPGPPLTDRGAYEVKLWDMNTGHEVCTFKGHTRVVFGVAFSPCGRRIASGGRDDDIRIWDGTPLAETPSRDGPVKAN